jgi:hypothetical protein
MNLAEEIAGVVSLIIVMLIVVTVFNATSKTVKVNDTIELPTGPAIVEGECYYGGVNYTDAPSSTQEQAPIGLGLVNVPGIEVVGYFNGNPVFADPDNYDPDKEPKWVTFTTTTDNGPILVCCLMGWFVDDSFRFDYPKIYVELMYGPEMEEC